MKKLLFISVILFINIGVFAQDLPTITWRQGDLRKINWGMSKTEVEQALGVKLKEWNNYNLVKSYTTNYSGTWINNSSFSFNCKTFTAQLSFYADKLFGIWFCTNANLKYTLTGNYGPGVSRSMYPSNENQREWWDKETYLMVDYEDGNVSIEKWAVNDKAYDRDGRQEDFERYLMLTKQ